MSRLFLISFFICFSVSARCQENSGVSTHVEKKEISEKIEKEIRLFANNYFLQFKKSNIKKSLGYFLDKDDVERLVWKIKEVEAHYNPAIGSMSDSLKEVYLSSVKRLKTDLKVKDFNWKKAYLREVNFDLVHQKSGIPTVALNIKIHDTCNEYYLTLGHIYFIRGHWKLSNEIKILN